MDTLGQEYRDSRDRSKEIRNKGDRNIGTAEAEVRRSGIRGAGVA